jgi:hypothetical protein
MHFINPPIFAHSRFDAVVATAVVESYLQHAAAEQDDINIHEGLLHVGRLIEKIKQCNDTEFDIAFEGGNDQKLLLLNTYTNELELLVNTLPEAERLNDIVLSCSPDTFLEVLMGNIRNALIGFQTWVSKTKRAKANNIILTLNRLKTNYDTNSELIFRLEGELTRIRDGEISAKIREIKLFDPLHNEKPSPLFLTLIKSSNIENLQCIRDDQGRPLSSDTERSEYITNTFSDIYRKKRVDPPVDYNT